MNETLHGSPARRSSTTHIVLLCTTLVVAACGVIGQPEIEPEPRREADIGSRVKQAFVSSDRVGAAAIQVGVDEQTIVLTGFVESDEEKQRAETLAADEFPRMTIDNRLEVK